MSYRVVLTHKAEADVESVLKWFHNQQAAEAGGRWLTSLLAKLDTLESLPERCRLAAEAADLGQEIRELLFGRKRFKHRLLFRIVGKTVQILRVWHSSRDAITAAEL